MNNQNGEIKSAKTKVESYDNYLDNFENNLGLNPFKLSSSIHQEAIEYLEIEADKRKKLTPEECSEAVLILSQFAAYIHRATQREEARCTWCKKQIDKCIRGRLSQQKGYGLEEKRLLGIAENEHAQELERIQLESQTKHERLLFLSQRIDKISDAYQNLSFVRRRKKEYD